MNRKNFFKLFILYLFALFAFGGCYGVYGFPGGGDDFIEPGQYYVLGGENFDHPDWSIMSDSYIRIHDFIEIDSDEFEISFSGRLYWRNGNGQISTRILPRRTIAIVKIDNYIYETRSSSDPYIWIEIFNDESFDLYADEFMVSL